TLYEVAITGRRASQQRCEHDGIAGRKPVLIVVAPHLLPSLYGIRGLSLFLGERLSLIVIEDDDLHGAPQLLADDCSHFGQRQGVRAAQFEGRSAQSWVGEHIRDGFSKVLGVHQPYLAIRRKWDRINALIADCLPACLKARLDVLHKDRWLDDVEGHTRLDHSFLDL